MSEDILILAMSTDIFQLKFEEVQRSNGEYFDLYIFTLMGPQYICTLMDFTPKCKLSSSLTYPHITPKLYDLLSLVAHKKWVTKCFFCPYIGSQWGPVFSPSSKSLLFVFLRGKLVLQAWNDMRLVKYWSKRQNFHIWVNYYFKFEMQIKAEHP